ncbi:type VII secretion protein EccE [Mycobacteroides abscessus]|uniref:type VII secretion protein EccE n=1 Tax=Mycobacteroides abscessus TaxID=36809 RepID=UPI0009A6E023|nr:type VII secretion protein EccE [Mycobacteroides abscessus]SLF48292.1 type VII secretion protein EccE [Mycobacteroides abscessus subsp. abscessus]
MKRPVMSVRIAVPAVLGAEALAAMLAAVALVAGLRPWWVPLAAGAVLGFGMFMLVFGDAPVWQWIWRWGRWLGHRQRHLDPIPEAADIDFDGTSVGYLIDGHTVITMLEVWGKQHMPTMLYPQRSQTPNLLPLSVVADQMNKVGLCVDVDVIVEGARAGGDSYAAAYDRYLGAHAMAGRRTTTLVLRLDYRALDTVQGLSWRPTAADAAAAVTCRMQHALQQAGCRAEVVGADRIAVKATAAVGGSQAAAETVEDHWSTLRQRGRGYVTSYYFSADDISSENIDGVWAYLADPNQPITHTTLVLALRRHKDAVRASAMVRLTSVQPLPAAPAPMLNRATGWQWKALQHTMPGAERIVDLPSAALTAALDSAIVPGPSGVLLGSIGDGKFLMPLADPAQPTRIRLDADDMYVRLLIRRQAANGERVAVYDPQGRWTMTSGSASIWTTTDMSAQPPRPPTLVVHNGTTNPYPAAWTSISVTSTPRRRDQSTDLTDDQSDIVIEKDGEAISVRTQRFGTSVDMAAFRNEQAFLN